MSWWLGGHTRVGVHDGALFAKLTYRPPVTMRDRTKCCPHRRLGILHLRISALPQYLAASLAKNS